MSLRKTTSHHFDHVIHGRFFTDWFSATNYRDVTVMSMRFLHAGTKENVTFSLYWKPEHPKNAYRRPVRI